MMSDAERMLFEAYGLPLAGALVLLWYAGRAAMRRWVPQESPLYAIGETAGCAWLAGACLLCVVFFCGLVWWMASVMMAMLFLGLARLDVGRRSNEKDR